LQPDWQRRAKFERLHASCSDPNVETTRVDEAGGGAQEPSQQTTLKYHEERRKRHPEHRRRETGAVMDDVLPSKSHFVCVNDYPLPLAAEKLFTFHFGGSANSVAASAAGKGFEK
jgi:hypothetical protein